MISKITKLTTLDIPELQIYRSLKRELDHREQGVFIAEGHFVVERLLKTNLHIKSVLFTEYWLEIFREKIQQRPEPVDVLIGEKELLRSITGYHLHQFIMALADVPEILELNKILESRKPPYLVVALDGLCSADNVGLVVRNCAAFGADLIVVGETTADPWLRRAVRKSMGNIFKIPVIYTDSLISTLSTLKSTNSFELFAAQVTPKSVNYFNSNFTKNCCLIVGNEGCGVSEPIIEICGKPIFIPMVDDVDSFNVSSAVAIILSEIIRQRKYH